MSFSILDNTLGKEAAIPARPLILVSIACADGDTSYFGTAATAGAVSIPYNGNTYLCRLQDQVIEAVQAVSPQGFDIIPSVELTIADGDASIWTNHCVPHGWRGAVLTLTYVAWDIPSNTYSSDAYQWRFILGNPGWANGVITVDSTSKMNMQRVKMPSVPISRRCPYDFPSTYLQRVAALNDPSSPYYQDGYSADVPGGCGNLQASTTLGGSGYTAGAPTVTVNSITGALPAVPFQFTISGNEFNCTAISGSTWTVEGGQDGTTDANASSGASIKVPFTSCQFTRAACMAQMGNPAGTLAPDGDITHDKSGNATGRFGGITWIPPVQYSGKQYTTGNQVYGYNQSNVAIFNQYWNFCYGSQWVNGTVVNTAGEPNSVRGEVVVCYAPFGTVPISMVLVNGVTVPQNNGSDDLFTWRYVNAGGRNGSVSTDAIYDSQGDPYGSLCCIEFVVPVELATSGSVQVQILVNGGPPVAVITDTGGVFTRSFEQTTNPVWHLLDLLCAGAWTYNLTNPSLADIDLASFCAAAAYCDVSISYLNLTGATATHERYRSSFVLAGTQQQTQAQAVTALRNSANLMLGPNSSTGLLQCFPRRTLADQQPSAIAGSNYNAPVSSTTALGAAANGYLAYLFQDNGSIEKGTFKISTRAIADTPNRVSFAFQDEDNQWQTDSISQIDPDAYVSSGNTPIDVPLQVNAIPNFDQATRVSNVQLSEALRGNPRDDAGGTLYFEFTTTMKAIHLVSMMGAICAVDWQQLGM